jgi:RNA polymerase sigma-70 factor (ECF subfamily)
MRNIWIKQTHRQRLFRSLVEIGRHKTTAHRIAETSGSSNDRTRKSEHQLVQEAIDKLAVSFREVLVLREYDNLSYQEMADVLGCPIPTLISRLRNAQSRLETLLSGDSPGIFRLEADSLLTDNLLPVIGD